MARKGLLLLLAGALLLGASACTSPFSADDNAVVREGDIVSGTGTIRYYSFEGGFYAIFGDDNQTYDPINLQRSLHRDGLRVRFRAKLRNDMGSFRQAGPIVEILEIREL